jgi:hypothetical protein
LTAFNKLAEAFDQGGEQSKNSGGEPGDTISMIVKSRAIVKAVDKLKAQGIKVTKKAELDYLLALRFLERNNVDLESPIPHASVPQKEKVTKRNPTDHPEEFETARQVSQQIVENVEDMMKQGKPVPDKKLEQYELCKRFLKKYQ